MKTLLGLTILLTLLVSCKGSGGGGDPSVNDPVTTCGIEYDLVGRWDSTTLNDTLTIEQNCNYESVYCGSRGTISPFPPSGSNKRIRLDKEEGNNDECVPVGSYICAYEFAGVNNNTLHYTCDGSTLSTFIRQ